MRVSTPIFSFRAAAALVTAVFAVSCSPNAQRSTEASAPAREAEVGALAFPGAVGHGRFSKGGRGGKLYFVTTLEDEGAGSLRECIEAEGPRVCIFRVGGVFRFAAERPLIKSPYLTIAGQTAPGDGVLIAHSGGEFGLTPIAIKETNDVIIRHIRVRPDRIGERRNSNSGFTVEESRNIVFDHVSASWARDENFTTQGENDDITVSWSIFAEGLKPHDKCALLASDPRGPQNVSFVGNLCAHNGDRNPDINFTPGSCVEVVNNVFYGATGEFAEVWESNGGSPVSIVGNVFRAGPGTPPQTPAITRWLIETKGDARIFAADNLLDGDLSMQTSNVAAVMVPEPPCPLSVAAVPARSAFEAVLGGAGAFPRDEFDARIVSDVINRRGNLVDVPGDLPPMTSDIAPADLDNDGMSDSWERSAGIDDAAFNPWDDTDGDGWLNLDEYLDYLHLQRLRTDEVG